MIRSRQARVARRGFTLVELLVAIAIIAILVSLTFGAVFMAQDAARVEKTRGLITKIDQIIVEKYESYRTRRVPITMTAAEATSTTGAQAFARRRLEALREIMRMELPDRWTDITLGDVTDLPARPALSQAYLRRHTASTPDIQFQGAECLYLILQLSGDDRAAMILERNTGDLDNDGAREIWDGWGRPISFLRWPQGYLEANGAITDLHSGDAAADHDPFDFRRQHAGAFALFPLIYSGGPDGVSDILSDVDYCEEEPAATAPSATTRVEYTDMFGTAPNNFTNNPLLAVGTSLMGHPYDWNGDGLEHLDNIHNHMLGIR